jgi:uncharacterized protein (TIGR03067 family)
MPTGSTESVANPSRKRRIAEANPADNISGVVLGREWVPKLLTRSTHFLREAFMKTVALLSMAFAAVLIAGLPIGAHGETDQQRLQGVWQVLAVYAFGKKGPAEAIKGMTYTFTGDTLVIAPAEPGSNSEFTITLDPAKKPKKIDLKIIKGPGKGETMVGIYDLDGDALEICFADKVRPTDFVTKAKSGAGVALKRKLAK